MAFCPILLPHKIYFFPFIPPSPPSLVCKEEGCYQNVAEKPKNFQCGKRALQKSLCKVKRENNVIINSNYFISILLPRSNILEKNVTR